MKEFERWMERLLQDLDGAGLGDVTAVLHGSGARGQYVPGWSDVNLLLIFERLDPAVLERLGPVLARWQADAKSAPLLFTRAEWGRAADAYPLEIAEMRTGYRVLRGADPLASARVRPADLRLALERELRGKLLRLRQGYALDGNRPEALAEGVRQGLSSLLVLFRGMMVLAGSTPPADPTGLVTATASLAGFEAAPLAGMVARRSKSDWRLERKDVAGVIAAVESAARFVDHFTHGEAS